MQIFDLARVFSETTHGIFTKFGTVIHLMVDQRAKRFYGDWSIFAIMADHFHFLHFFAVFAQKNLLFRIYLQNGLLKCYSNCFKSCLYYIAK